jgi:hypothetical protein
VRARQSRDEAEAPARSVRLTSVLNRLVGSKKIRWFAMMPGRMMTAPATVSSQPAIDFALKNRNPTPTISGTNVSPKGTASRRLIHRVLSRQRWASA